MAQTVVSKIFWWIANGLLEIADKTGLTYNEVNILVYYLFIPLTWTIMLDLILRMPITPLCCFWRGAELSLQPVAVSTNGVIEYLSCLRNSSGSLVNMCNTPW